ncbi:MAG: HAD family hydrolase [Deltaproteobacteria bacterium HGW-Deltaproteobacteria-4]|nr:MAG: HAD family hydrolase [Deltaproteobacteria bacterium HGW-Deltaproteobacteria-4]
MSYAPILFDLDGTLIDSLADLTTALNLLRGELNLSPVTIPAVRACVGDGATLLVRRVLGDDLFSPSHLQRFLTLYSEHLAEETTLYPGIRTCLDRFSDRPLAVVTNKPYQLTMDLLHALDLNRYFAVVIGGDSCPVKKPDPTPIKVALHRLDATAAGAIMIGDHHTDLKSGQAAGLDVCFCTWGFGDDGGCKPNHRVDNATELLQVLL